MAGEDSLASIGIPVFQGEDYLEDALQSALAQDYQPLEIIVSDNASTDGTAEIVQRHASDPRVRFLEQSHNIGAAENFNAALRSSRGAYFAWNAHDDFSSPDFVSSAVAALEANPDAVVAVGRPFWVDEKGDVIEEIALPRELTSPDPAVRLRAAAGAHPAAVIFGLYRVDLLNRTQLFGGFTGSDRNLVAETLLYGRLVLAGESEFYLREHPGRSVRRLRGEEGSRFSHPREGWFDPTREGKLVFPSWRRFGRYATAINRAPLSLRQRVACYGALGGILRDDNFKLLRYMANDLVTATLFMARRWKQGEDGDVVTETHPNPHSEDAADSS